MGNKEELSKTVRFVLTSLCGNAEREGRKKEAELAAKGLSSFEEFFKQVTEARNPPAKSRI